MQRKPVLQKRKKRRKVCSDREAAPAFELYLSMENKYHRFRLLYESSKMCITDLKIEIKMLEEKGYMRKLKLVKNMKG